jgi:hypothetical protein
MRRAAKVDSNQKEIVDGLKSMGFSVCHLHTLGKGRPDILVGGYGMNFMYEIKDGAKPASQQKLTEDEIKFHNTWIGHLGIAKSADDIIRDIDLTISNLNVIKDLMN